MIALAFIAAAIVQGAISASDERDMRLDWLRNAASASFYADDHFRCEGLPPKLARQRARRALGKDFDERIAHVAEQLARLYGQEAVREQTEQIAIGYKITPARCAQVRSIVRDARSSLSKLESAVGAF